MESGKKVHTNSQLTPMYQPNFSLITGVWRFAKHQWLINSQFCDIIARLDVFGLIFAH